MSATWSSQSSSTRCGRGSPVTTRQASTSSSAALTVARSASSRSRAARASSGRVAGAPRHCRQVRHRGRRVTHRPGRRGRDVWGRGEGPSPDRPIGHTRDAGACAACRTDLGVGSPGGQRRRPRCASRRVDFRARGHRLGEPRPGPERRRRGRDRRAAPEPVAAQRLHHPRHRCRGSRRPPEPGRDRPRRVARPHRGPERSPRHRRRRGHARPVHPGRRRRPARRSRLERHEERCRGDGRGRRGANRAPAPRPRGACARRGRGGRQHRRRGRAGRPPRARHPAPTSSWWRSRPRWPSPRACVVTPWSR